MTRKVSPARVAVIQSELKQLKKDVGSIVANDDSVRAIFHWKRGKMAYWTRKSTDPSFHPGQHGGHRYQKWNPDTVLGLKLFIWVYVQENPFCRRREIVAAVHHNLHLDLKYTMLSDMFKAWNWSFHKAGQITQLAKYTFANLAYYETFLVEIQFIPWDRIKFLDEASFHSKDCRRTVVLGPKNYPVQHLSNAGYCTVFILFASDSSQILTNDQVSFLNSLVHFVNIGALQANDILVLDNASIHKGKTTKHIREALYSAYHIHVSYYYSSDSAMTGPTTHSSTPTP
ncbi:hypothetical protein Pelo_18082 [Pelomyxa schiedti]|nr:hypothetical protein Pelo_18082 [Pelomyxa schiedti]